MPELYRFVYDSLDCNPKLVYGDNVIISVAGSQQDDPLSELEFCESVQPPILLEREAQTTLGFVYDIDLEGEISSVARDVQAIIDSHLLTGLLLNECKCEITAKNFDIIDETAVFKDFKRIVMADLTLVGAPIREGRAVDNALQDKIFTLERSITRLSKLQSHDALCLLKNLLAMPKLLYILRTSPCANNPLLHEFDTVLRAELESTLNIQLSDEHGKQASLPVPMEGLGVRSACMLASSVFLAAAAATLPLQEATLSAFLAGVDDSAVNNAKTALTSQANTSEPSDAAKHIQRAWDAHIAMAVYHCLLQTCSRPSV